MKKYNRYLFFVSLVVAFLSFAAMPGIPGLVANIHAAEPFDGIPVFSAGTTPSSSASSTLPPGCTPAQIDKVGASGYDLEEKTTQHRIKPLIKTSTPGGPTMVSDLLFNTNLSPVIPFLVIPFVE